MFRSTLMSVFSSVIFLFFVACDVPGGGSYNDASSDVSSYNVRFADVGGVYDALSDDALVFSEQGFVPTDYFEEGDYDPGDPPYNLDYVEPPPWQEPAQACKADQECTKDDGDPLTDIVGCDVESHRCIHAPPDGCFTIRSSGAIHGEPQGTVEVIPDPTVYPWTANPSGNGHHFSFCPLPGWNYFNSVDLATGEWAADWDSCPGGQVDYSVFVGGKDALDEAGCLAFCYGSSTYDPPSKRVLQLQCSAYYLPEDSD